MSSSGSSSDESDYDTQKKKRKMASKKPVPKKATKKRVVESSSEDSDSDDSSSSSDNSSDSGDSSEEEVEEKPKKARVSTSSSSSRAVVKPKKKSSSSSSSGAKVTGSAKKRTKMERVEEARKAYKWWEAAELPDGINWRNLEHTGVVFAPNHVRHFVPLLYEGERVEMTIEQEEIATFYAAIPEDGPQLGNPKTRSVFQKNFFIDFKATLPPGHVIKKFDKCDFSLIKAHLDTQKSLKKAATDDEKAKRKEAKELISARHGYSLIDGRIEKVGNYNVEPPGLFRGRGEHPRTGVLKQRCFAESIFVNCCEDSAVPRVVGLPGHAWESVRHDPTVTWLCKWNENVLDQTKYVMLAASSSFKGKSDQEKYGKAIRLKGCIGSIRKNYTSKIKSKDKADRQLGVAMWVIDVLALRVGGEKGDDEADTVGCCSLRVEHMRFVDKDDPENYEIELEFLGKDSMLFRQTINFAQYGDLAKTVYQCLKSFCAHKKPTDEVFETLSPPVLNKHLSSLMDGLTAKVFRTYNASVTLENELPAAEELSGLPIAEKVIRFNAANRQVAILCNHQKTVSKATETMFETLNEKLETLKSQLEALKT
jgi:DNA topoisomerase I